MKSKLPAEATLLLVDDSRNGLLVRRAILEGEGFQVKMAGNGEEGLKLFEALHFDVVVTDYRMPRMNGTELIERMRKLDPQVRVVLISSVVEPLGLKEENTGADAVIAKDANEPAHLLRAVRRLMSRPPRKPARSQTARRAHDAMRA